MSLNKRLIKTNEAGPAVIPTDSLLGFFKFDNNLNDETGQGNLQASGGSYVAGKFGNALYWNTSSTASRTSTSYGNTLTSITNATQSYSVSIWVQLSAVRRNIFWYVDKPIGSTGMEFSYNSAVFQMQMYLPAPEYRFVGPFLQTGVWYHFASTYNSTNSVTKHYLDGVEIFSGALNVGGGTTDCFGHLAGTVGMHGLLDQTRFYSRVITPQEVIALYQEV